MGTRGLLIIRCRGRYFIYYNQFDSYPEGLGQAIVNEIPQDPERYQKWLESMRESYSRMVQEFEDNHLPVIINDDDDDENSSPLSRSEMHARCHLALDDRLEWPPAQTTPDFRRFIWLEWTYTIDLDREVFSVDSAAHFKLSKIPRPNTWAKYLVLDKRGRRKLSPKTPEECVASVIWNPTVDAQAKARYRWLNIKLVSPKTAIDPNYRGAPGQYFREEMFKLFSKEYRGLLDQNVLDWRPEDFPFREFAFALLSLASGQMTFECPEVLDSSYKSEGYYKVPVQQRRYDKPKLLPKYLSECHQPGVESGSAPLSRTYWFENVLVHLASRLDLVDVEEVSVAEVVDIGLSQGHKHFHAIVFSALDFVLIQVHTAEDGKVVVERSGLMNLFYFDDTNSGYVDGPRSRIPQKRASQDCLSGVDDVSEEDGQEDVDREDSEPRRLNFSDTDDDSEQDEQESIGQKDHERSPQSSCFIALVHFFDAAANQRVKGAGKGVFPVEIFTSIMEFADEQTYRNLAKTAPWFLEMSQRKFRFNNEYAVVGTDPKLEKFVFENVQTGDQVETSIHHRGEEGRVQWMAVVGISQPARRSIIDSVDLFLSNVVSPYPPCTVEVELPSRDQFASLSSFYMRRDENEKETPCLKIPDYAYPGFIEREWGLYLQRVINRDELEFGMFSCAVEGGHYRCILPLRCRELRVTMTFPYFELLAFVRSVNDENTKEWRKTLEYAVSRLTVAEMFMPYRTKEGKIRTRGRPLIVAFGTKAKLFYFVYRNNSSNDDNDNNATATNDNDNNNDEEDHQWQACSQSLTLRTGARAFVSAKDPDPMKRLVQLIPGDEPFDMNDEAARAELERWILLFRDGCKRKKEYDPLTEQYLPVIGLEKKDAGNGGNGDEDEGE